MLDLPDRAGQRRAVLVLRGPADLAEAERAQRAAVALVLADLAADLGDPKLRHPWSPPRLPQPRRAPAAVPPLPRRPASAAAPGRSRGRAPSRPRRAGAGSAGR